MECEFCAERSECRLVSAKEPTLDGIILESLKQKLTRMLDEESLKLETENSHQSQTNNESSLANALESVKKAKQMLFEKLADRSIDRETFKIKKQEYDAEIAELEQKISDSNMAQQLVDDEAQSKVEMAKTFLDVESMTEDMWKRFVSDAIVYPGGRLEIHWNFEEEI